MGSHDLGGEEIVSSQLLDLKLFCYRRCLPQGLGWGPYSGVLGRGVAAGQIAAALIPDENAEAKRLQDIARLGAAAKADAVGCGDCLADGAIGFGPCFLFKFTAGKIGIHPAIA